MQKKKVLLVSCTGLGNGGVQAVIMSIVRNLSSKYLFDIICFNRDDHYKAEFESYGGRVFLIENKNNRYDYYLQSGRIYRGCFKIMRENGPYDAVHCHNYFESAVVLKAAKAVGISTRIAHSHNTSIHSSANFLCRALENKYKRMISKLATDRLGCSRGACEFLYGEDSAIVVHNAIDLEKYNKNIFPQRSPDGAVRMLHVGRYCDQKNQLFLIDIFSEYLKKNSNAYLSFVGFGNDKDKVRAKIDEMSLTDKIDMLPHDSDVAKVMSENDVVVFPSKFEGLGIVLIEAQAMGLRCFVSDAVPLEADLGNCMYIPLAEGAEKWARIIDEDLNKNGTQKRYVDMSAYDINNVVKIYDSLYSAQG